MHLLRYNKYIFSTWGGYMSDLERARQFFSKDLYATEATGIVIDSVGEKYAKCSLKLDRRHQNAVGAVMGGVMFTFADFVFAVATNFESESVTVTLVSQISYLSAVKGDTLYGESKLIKDGRNNCFYEIHITDNLGTAVATVAVTGAHLRKQ